MYVTSLEQMEKIVSGNKALHWDGWTVVSTRFNPVAWRKPNGVFIKGKWYLATRYEPTKRGWDVPKKMVAENGQA